jgi:hypothetical protein
VTSTSETTTTPMFLLTTSYSKKLKDIKGERSNHFEGFPIDLPISYLLYEGILVVEF